jgi:hypothetical protein
MQKLRPWHGVAALVLVFSSFGCKIRQDQSSAILADASTSSATADPGPALLSCVSQRGWSMQTVQIFHRPGQAGPIEQTQEFVLTVTERKDDILGATPKLTFASTTYANVTGKFDAKGEGLVDLHPEGGSGVFRAAFEVGGYRGESYLNGLLNVVTDTVDQSSGLACTVGPDVPFRRLNVVAGELLADPRLHAVLADVRTKFATQGQLVLTGVQAPYYAPGERPFVEVG